MLFPGRLNHYGESLRIGYNHFVPDFDAFEILRILGFHRKTRAVRPFEGGGLCCFVNGFDGNGHYYLLPGDSGRFLARLSPACYIKFLRRDRSFTRLEQTVCNRLVIGDLHFISDLNLRQVSDLFADRDIKGLSLRALQRDKPFILIDCLDNRGCRNCPFLFDSRSL